MIEGLTLFNVSIEIAGVMLSFLGILLVAGYKPFIEKNSRVYFTAFFACLALDLLSMIGADFIGGRAGNSWRFLHIVCYFSHFFFSPMMGCIATIYLFTLINPHGERKWLWRAFFGVSASYFAMLVVTLFNGLYWYIDESNQYRRGSGYWFAVVFSVLPLVLDMIILVCEGKRLTSRQRRAFWVYSALPTLACVVQLFSTGLHLIIPATIIAALTMFIFVLTDQTEQYHQKQLEAARLEKEKTQLRMSVMLSQIQPHFLYNALGTIQNLCHKDPEAAEEAVGMFARYLRRNMASLSSADLIPFTEELEHTKNYLTLEKLRFKESLQIQYDTRCVSFHVPPLTVQPIAENAVSHGVRKNHHGKGTVVIRSEEYPDRYEIQVADDGPGFDPEQIPADGKNHIGIQNVRERLHTTVSGSLIIESAPSQGTKVTITIPKKGGMH